MYDSFTHTHTYSVYNQEKFPEETEDDSEKFDGDPDDLETITIVEPDDWNEVSERN